MNKRFGGKIPTGTPSLAVNCRRCSLTSRWSLHRSQFIQARSCKLSSFTRHATCSMKCLAEPNICPVLSYW
ncbi:hypothetical protein F2Q70_00033105 [Brassica cretica]|uniref:Uncharacterized protein n=1 Tax=Brassica cretica TaxID=69181 RepID=A0A8S9FD57_BRACR|nr:hypothetical protein F2Q70_00033105 [Brassica cretica]